MYIVAVYTIIMLHAHGYLCIIHVSSFEIYMQQQKKRIFLLFRFTSLKVIIFYFLLSKQICHCMAIGFAAFSCQNAVCRRNYADFCQKKAKITKFLLMVSGTQCSIRFRSTQVPYDVTNWKTV